MQQLKEICSNQALEEARLLCGSVHLKFQLEGA